MRKITRRGGFWHFVRRVPRQYQDLDKRGVVRLSTEVRVADDPHGIVAARRAESLNAATEAYWRSLVDGRSSETIRRYEAARSRARSMGFDYVPAAELAERPLSAVLERLEKLITDKRVDDPTAVSAALGGEEPANIRLSEMFGVYEALVKAELTDMSPDQLRKWRNPRMRAISNLMKVVGDKNIRDLSRADALDFVEWWQERILNEGLLVGTANKDINNLNRMLRRIDRWRRLNMDQIFTGLRLEGGVERTRPPFDPEFVQKRLFDSGALASLNPDARRVVLLMADTGLRLSEATNLNERTIVLDADVPHVQVRPDGRRMKTPQSYRDVPLVGAALAAMREQPTGFSRYRNKGDSLSATVNKFLETNGLLPSDEHSLYSLRHTFKDRLVNVEAPEELVDNLMGHRSGKPKYGTGASLRLKHRWLQRIAFRPPAIV